MQCEPRCDSIVATFSPHMTSGTQVDHVHATAQSETKTALLRSGTSAQEASMACSGLSARSSSVRLPMNATSGRAPGGGEPFCLKNRAFDYFSTRQQQRCCAVVS